MDQTVTVSGRQYDRIGDLKIGDAEVWWGTTEEPSGEGNRPITYHFDKDLTPYAALLRTPQPFRGGIENFTSDVYTGVYAQTVTLTYYRADRKHPAPDVADHVAGMGHADATPAAPTVHFTAKDLPRNITRAQLEVTLEGHACDEQWFDDVPDEVSAKYPAAGMCGHGPYREANFAIDGTAMRLGVHLPAHLLRRHRPAAVAADRGDRHVQPARRDLRRHAVRGQARRRRRARPVVHRAGHRRRMDGRAHLAALHRRPRRADVRRAHPGRRRGGAGPADDGEGHRRMASTRRSPRSAATSPRATSTRRRGAFTPASSAPATTATATTSPAAASPSTSSRPTRASRPRRPLWTAGCGLRTGTPGPTR